MDCIVLQTREEALELPRRHADDVLIPLSSLVPEEVLEHVLAERLGDQLGSFHHFDRLGQ